MIHAYEGALDWAFQQILLTCLYKDLSRKIDNLDGRLVENCHASILRQNALIGGCHSVLFYLKSLDLDLRCGFELGTVWGYGGTPIDWSTVDSDLQDLISES